jgi:hypothetical protein
MQDRLAGAVTNLDGAHRAGPSVPWIGRRQGAAPGSRPGNPGVSPVRSQESVRPRYEIQRLATRAPVETPRAPAETPRAPAETPRAPVETPRARRVALASTSL